MAGTTRMCPDDADGDAMCFQQCADTEALACTAADTDGNAVMECVRDEMTGDYMMVDGDFVAPDGEDACVAFLVDGGGCDDEDSDLEVVISGAAEETCYDVNCSILSEADCE